MVGRPTIALQATDLVAHCVIGLRLLILYGRLNLDQCMATKIYDTLGPKRKIPSIHIWSSLLSRWKRKLPQIHIPSVKIYACRNRYVHFQLTCSNILAVSQRKWSQYFEKVIWIYHSKQKSSRFYGFLLWHDWFSVASQISEDLNFKIYWITLQQQCYRHEFQRSCTADDE